MMKLKFIASLLVMSCTLVASSNLRADSSLETLGFTYGTPSATANFFSFRQGQEPLVLAQAQPVPPAAPGAAGPTPLPPPPPSVTAPAPPPPVPTAPERTLLPPPAVPSGGMVSLNFTRADLIEI